MNDYWIRYPGNRDFYNNAKVKYSPGAGPQPRRGEGSPGPPAQPSISGIILYFSTFLLFAGLASTFGASVWALAELGPLPPARANASLNKFWEAGARPTRSDQREIL